jgi:hypothetical protein
MFRKCRRQQHGHWCWDSFYFHQQFCTTVFPQQLSATTTWRHMSSISYASDGDEPASTAHVQLADHGALSTQRETIRRIFYIATRDDSSIVDQGCGTDAKF